MAVSESSTLMTAVFVLGASSRTVLEAIPVKLGASLTVVAAMLNVFVTASVPPLTVPPLSFITMVMRFVPIAFVAVLNMSVPFVLMLGTSTYPKFVPDVTVNAKV